MRKLKLLVDIPKLKSEVQSYEEKRVIFKQKSKEEKEEKDNENEFQEENKLKKGVGKSTFKEADDPLRSLKRMERY